MGRLFFVLLVVGGGVLAWKGWADYALSRGAGEAPEAVTVAELEQGLPTNRWRSLGPHEPVVRLATHAEKDGQVLYFLYPVVDEAAWARAKAGPLAKYAGDVIRMPVAELTAALDIRVLVKTNRYASEAELNMEWGSGRWPRQDVSGLVVAADSSLGKAELEMLAQILGRFDPNQVVVLEEGRTPSSPWRGLGMMGGGAVLALLGFAARVRRWRKRTDDFSSTKDERADN